MRKLTIFIISTLILSVSCNRQEKIVVDEETGQIFNDSGFIRIATMPTIDCLPFYIAKERGLFDKEGIQVSFHCFTSHMDIDTALVGGSVDGAFSDIIRTDYLQRKGKVKLNYLSATELQWWLISNKAARLNRLDQFGDKMIASTRFSATDYLTDITFAEVKTTNPVYRVQINDVNVRLGMLLNNEMDAEWLPEPQATKAIIEGNKVLVKPKKDDLRFGVLAFRSKFAGKNKEKMDKLSKVYSMACDSLNKNGIQAYSAELYKYCKVDTSVVNHMPKMIFIHAGKPTEKVLEAAHQYLK